jgi:hypothetical protein
MNIPEFPVEIVDFTNASIAQLTKEVKSLRQWNGQVFMILKETIGTDDTIGRMERTLERYQERIATLEISHNELKKSLAFWKDLMDKENTHASE